MKTCNGLITAILFLSFIALTLQTTLATDLPVEMQKNATSIKDIIKNTPAYDGKDLVIQGKIQTECPAGCWFIVDDGVASIYIDILPSNFVIPQEAGSDVRVFGTVTKKDGDPIVIGKIVEINGEIFK
jgi:hypothetical protein